MFDREINVRQLSPVSQQEETPLSSSEAFTTKLPFRFVKPPSNNVSNLETATPLGSSQLKSTLPILKTSQAVSTMLPTCEAASPADPSVGSSSASK